MSNLPNEIREDILVRLPASSLLRFSSVSKQWLSLISNPNFVTKHLNHVLSDLDGDQSNNHHNKLIVHNSIYSTTSNFLYSIDYKSLNATKLNLPLQSPRARLRILGSSNGLLCILFFEDGDISGHGNIVLWNPLLRDHNQLPQSSSISGGSLRLIGFGYDPSTDDYKVMRVITNSGFEVPIEHKVEIYTLKTNSWRRIRGIPYGTLFFPSLIQGTLVNGSLYWVSMDEFGVNYNQHYCMIIRFDLTDEKFSLVEIPRDDDGDGDMEPRRMQQTTCISIFDYRIRSFGEVRGCLGLYKMDFNLCDIEVWILKEDENKNGFWSKLMEIPKENGMWAQPVCFMKNDEVLLRISKEGLINRDKKLVVYNPANMTFRNLPACGTSFWSEEMINVETLVSPRGAGW